MEDEAVKFKPQLSTPIKGKVKTNDKLEITPIKNIGEIAKTFVNQESDYRNFYNNSNFSKFAKINPDSFKVQQNKEQIIEQYSDREQPHAILEIEGYGSVLMYPGSKMELKGSNIGGIPNPVINCVEVIQGNDLNIRAIFEIEHTRGPADDLSQQLSTVSLERFDEFSYDENYDYGGMPSMSVPNIRLMGVTPPQSKKNLPYVTLDLVNSQGQIIDIIKAHPGDSIGGLQIKNINNDFALYNLGVEIIHTDSKTNKLADVRLGESVNIGRGNSLRVREVGSNSKTKASFNIEMGGNEYYAIAKEGEEVLANKIGRESVSGLKYEKDYIIIKPRTIVSGPHNLGKETVIFDIEYSINGNEGSRNNVKLEKGKIKDSSTYTENVVDENSMSFLAGTNLIKITFDNASFGSNY